jgi:NAD+ kinase
MVLPGDSIIKVILISPTERVYLTMDGQVGFSVMQNDVIEVSKAPFKTRLLIPCDRDYFQILRTKLKWGER